MGKLPGLYRWIALLLVVPLWTGCGGGVGAQNDGGASSPKGSTDPGTPPPQSVGEVTSDAFPGELVDPGQAPPSAYAAISVRNQTTSTASVTALFSADGRQVHVAYVRVPPSTVSTMSSPVPANRIQLSAATDDGSVAVTRTFVLGIDYSTDAMAELTLEAATDSGSGTGSPGSGFVPPSLSIVEPKSESMKRAIGSDLRVQWTDEGGSSLATIAFVLRTSAGARGAYHESQVSPDISISMDGINDEVRLFLAGVPAGAYELVAVVRDGPYRSEVMVVPQLTMFVDPTNAPPKVTLRSPSAPVVLRAREGFDVCWDDDDPDSAATIMISLFRLMPSGESVSYPLSPPMPEDVDGAGDCLRIVPSQILPGAYDLVATISDGVLTGVHRLTNWVEIQGVETDLPPHLTLLHPEVDVELNRNGALYVSWTDEDLDSSAIISLMLDPDLAGEILDGNEILLISALAEDPDGPGNDDIRIGLPAGVGVRQYRLIGTITDGRSTVPSVARGYVRVVDRSSGEGSTLPTVEVVWPLTNQYLRSGYGLTFGARVHNVEPGQIGTRFQLRAVLTHELYTAPLLAVSTELRNGTSFNWTADTGLLAIPETVRGRDLRIVVDLYEGETLVSSDAAQGLVFVRRDLAPLYLTGVFPDCEGHGGIPKDARIEFGWVGGGTRIGDSFNTVRFWAAKDGVWPPPLDDDRTHRVLLQRIEEVGVRYDEVVPWSALGGMDPGTYTLIAEVLDSQLGGFTHRFEERTITVCGVGRSGGEPIP